MAASETTYIVELDNAAFYRLCTGTPVTIGGFEIVLDPGLTAFRLIQIIVDTANRPDWLEIIRLIAAASGADSG
jgi:hypothetical protein